MKPDATDQLEPSTVDMLVQILHKDPNDMSEADKAFLRARKDYIKQKHIDALPQVFVVDEKEQARLQKAQSDAKKKADDEALKAQEAQQNVLDPQQTEDQDDDEDDDSDDSDDEDAEG